MGRLIVSLLLKRVGNGTSLWIKSHGLLKHECFTLDVLCVSEDKFCQETDDAGENGEHGELSCTYASSSATTYSRMRGNISSLFFHHSSTLL